MLTDFHNSYTDRLISKLAAMLFSNISPHLRHVVRPTPPCGIYLRKNKLSTVANCMKDLIIHSKIFETADKCLSSDGSIFNFSRQQLSLACMLMLYLDNQ